MERITREKLQAAADQINRMTNSPMEPWVKQDDGTFKAAIGCYFVTGAYGGNGLSRMVNEGGGEQDILGGYRPKRELLDLMRAFIRGLEAR